MRKLLTLFGIALFAMGLVGCDKDDDDEGIEIYTEAGEGGTLSITTEDGQNAEQKKFKLGDKVIVTATPDSGYYFSQWSDGDTVNPRTFEITPYFKIGVIFLPTNSVTKSSHSVIDLGLPSGTLWATNNLGAVNPWDYGTYYAWGETTPKSENYSWETYKYCSGFDSTLTKYCNSKSYGNDGYTDALTTLQATDDVATAVLGSDYSMPTSADWQELVDSCYWVWTADYNGQGVAGYIVYRVKQDSDKGRKVYGGAAPSASYSLVDTHIFLPAAGAFAYSALNDFGSFGYYWSASLYKSDQPKPNRASYCAFNNSFVNADFNGLRYYGFSIRPIKRRTN